MTAEDTIRFLDHEARGCRDRDSHEAFCLLLPAIVKVLHLEPMDDFEAANFAYKFKRELWNHCNAHTARV